MKKLKIFPLITLLLVAIASVIGLFSNISDFDPPKVSNYEISFEHKGNLLQGSYFEASKNGPIVLLVHGDGPQNRTSDDGYMPLINSLVEKGISIYIWDKPGVGQSKGNWLDQTMEDRAHEVVAATKAIRNFQDVNNRSIGLLGFSQAGWVLPRMPLLTREISFLVIIGAAISWRDQNIYYTYKKLEKAGEKPDSITNILERTKVQNQKMFNTSVTYKKYLLMERSRDGIGNLNNDEMLSEERFNFIKKNIDEDSRAFLSSITLPVLLLLGENDLNVDPKETFAVYSEILKNKNSKNHFVIIPNATHSLFVADKFNYQLPSQWPLYRKIQFAIYGRKSYAPDVLNKLSDWLLAVTRS